MDNMIERCAGVVSKWSERAITHETVNDFAAVFGMELNWNLAPVEIETPKEPQDPQQYDIFTELSGEDKYAMKSWRENSGLL
jgi:hypothetical protein